MNAPDRFVQILVVNLARISRFLLKFCLSLIPPSLSRIMIFSRNQGSEPGALLSGKSVVFQASELNFYNTFLKYYGHRTSIFPYLLLASLFSAYHNSFVSSPSSRN